MDTLFFQQPIHRETNLNGLGEPLTITALIAASPKIAETVQKLAKFFSGIISNDNGIIAARDKMLAYIRARFKNYSAIETDLITPLLTYYKLRHADIPNVKIFGSYDAEAKRLVECMAAYLTLYEPQFLQKFYDSIQQIGKPSHAFLNAVINQPAISRDEIASYTTPFTSAQISAALQNANKAGGIESFTQPAGSTSTVQTAVNAYQVVRDAYGNILQPGTPQYQQAVQQQQAAGSGSNAIVWVLLVGAAVAVAAVATTPSKPKK